MDIPDDRWLDATRSLAAQGSDGQPVLAADDVALWREAGYCVVDGIFDEALIDSVIDHALARFPAPGTDDAAAIADFGSEYVFPSNNPAFNDITLEPRLLTAVAQLLDRNPNDLRLTQSDLWPKYGRPVTAGRQDNQDQRIHVDYPNHTLAHPSPWHRPEAVEMILYYSDVDAAGGPTAVVPRSGRDDPAYPWPIVDTPGVGDLDYVNDRESAEAYLTDRRPELTDWRQSLYERERYVRYRKGTLVMYRHDVWHRGTPMTDGALRLAHNMTFRTAEAEWISTLHSGWAWKAYRPNKYIERLIATASLDQRAVLGFPQPDSPYWCEETIAAVEARHGVFGMDMTPYRDAIASR